MIGVRGSFAMSSFGVPKLGNSDAEWEDAAAHSERLGRFAVADGAAAAYHAGLWSHLLVRHFITAPAFPGELHELEQMVATAAVQWHDLTRVDAQAPYYVRHAQERGSHATFLGVEILPSGHYRAVAVGDSCLFQLRQGEPLAVFPVERPEDFDYHPELIATSGLDGARVSRLDGRTAEGDVLLASTDAVAEWLMRTHRSGDSTVIDGLLGELGGLDEFVARARQVGALHNDDVAVVRCAHVGARR